MSNIVAVIGSCTEYSHLSGSSDKARHILSKELGVWEPCRRACISTILLLVDAYQVTDETAAHTIVLLDRFLATQIQDAPDIQRAESRTHRENAFGSKSGLKGTDECYAAACFLLATKFREIESPCIRDIARIIASTCPEKIGLCETEVLECISWELHATTGLVMLNFDFSKSSFSLVDLFTIYSL